MVQVLDWIAFKPMTDSCGIQKSHMRGEFAIMASYPGRERSERFSEEETLHLVQEVKDRQVQIYGDSKAAPKPHKVKQAWSEVAASVSSSSGINCTADQCRKRYNDVRRRGKQKDATNKQQAAVTGGGPSTFSDLTPAEALASSTLPKASVESFGGLQIGDEGLHTLTHSLTHSHSVISTLSICWKCCLISLKPFDRPYITSSGAVNHWTVVRCDFKGRRTQHSAMIEQDKDCLKNTLLWHLRF
ncbi:hypothetical protein WMY93_010362 [Mugilogobius chulae]|uniref:Myb/SANT-like DNA-binding domain-containing protein n=1 Tax=Mugilogobius chulae TaxID=88201 RepID=A0AAW0PDE1_9GOBI